MPFLLEHMSPTQNPVIKWSAQNHASRIKKAAAAIYGSLTNLHLPESVLSGSHGVRAQNNFPSARQASARGIYQARDPPMAGRS